MTPSDDEQTDEHQSNLLPRAKQVMLRKVTSAVSPAIAFQYQDLAERLERVEAELARVSGLVAELKQIAEAQVDVVVESTALLGRLVRSAEHRLDELEASLPDEP